MIDSSSNAKRYTYTFAVVLNTMLRHAHARDEFKLHYQADNDLEAMKLYCLNTRVQDLSHEDINHVIMFCKDNKAGETQDTTFSTLNKIL